MRKHAEEPILYRTAVEVFDYVKDSQDGLETCRSKLAGVSWKLTAQRRVNVSVRITT